MKCKINSKEFEKFLKENLIPLELRYISQYRKGKFPITKGLLPLDTIAGSFAKCFKVVNCLRDRFLIFLNGKNESFSK